MTGWAGAASLCGAALVATAGVAQAVPAPGGGYGPGTGNGGTAPGGYSAVVMSQTVNCGAIGPSGTTIGPAPVDGASDTVTIPPGSCVGTVQVTLTAPDLGSIGSAGFPQYHAVAGVGVQVQQNGAPYPGTFLKPMTLAVRSGAISGGSVMVVWNGTAFVTDPRATVSAGSALTSFVSDPNYAVLAPNSAIPGATTPVTGTPLRGEVLIAVVLALLGAGGLIFARRVRA